MAALFELLYREFCRARLGEMRKQLLLRDQHPKLFLPDDDPSDLDGMEPQKADLKRAKE
jgi:hypothetical protein